MNNTNLFFKYKNAMDFENGLYHPTKPHESLEIIADTLESSVNNKDSFMEIKDLVFSCPLYPSFVHFSKLYKEEFYNFFKEKDQHLFNHLLAYMIDKMVYNNTLTVSEAIPEYSLSTQVNLSCKDTFYDNKIMALCHYNYSLFELLVNKSRLYVTTYNKEVEVLKRYTDYALTNNFWHIFKQSKTYHLRLKLINELYPLLTGEYKDIIYQIIVVGLSSEDTFIRELHEEFDFLKLAYNYKNKCL